MAIPSGMLQSYSHICSQRSGIDGLPLSHSRRHSLCTLLTVLESGNSATGGGKAARDSGELVVPWGRERRRGRYSRKEEGEGEVGLGWGVGGGGFSGALFPPLCLTR